MANTAAQMTQVILSHIELSHVPWLAHEGTGEGLKSMEKRKKQVLVFDKG